MDKENVPVDWGGFVMPAKNRVEAFMGSRMHTMSPSEDRADKRSETPMGFAHAVFNANHAEVGAGGGE